MPRIPAKLSTAALLSLALILGGGALVAAPLAQAAPGEVEVRIEGRTETLFEGPVLSEGHDIEAASDTSKRPCNGLANSKYAAPGPTPTTAAVDAMSIVGDAFDGIWYPEIAGPGRGDYLITRWGPEREAEGESWSLYENDLLLDKGGCQWELAAGAQVVWEIGRPAFHPLLALYPEGSYPGAPPLTATAELGKPFQVEVDAYHASKESEPPAAPSRSGSTPVEGASVSPVKTATNGFELVETDSPESVKTNSAGVASITFTSPGWHRIKATATASVRSNRLDVCVPAEGATGCGALPAEDLPRSVIAGSGEEEHKTTTTPESPVTTTPQPPPPPPSGGIAAFSVLHIDGLTLTPIDDRTGLAHYRGRWVKLSSPAAWRGTLTRGSAGASVQLRLGTGRPVFLLRGASAGARVSIRAGGHTQTITLHRSSAALTHLLLGARRSRAGAVTLRILDGTVGLDGVALIP